MSAIVSEGLRVPPLVVRAHRGETLVTCAWPPLDGTGAVGEYFHVVGWAYCAAGISGVTLTLCGREIPVPVFSRSADVRGALPGFPGLVSSFRTVVDARALPPGEHVLTIRASGSGASGSAVVAGPVSLGADMPYRVWRTAHPEWGRPDPPIAVPEPLPAVTVGLVGCEGRDRLEASLHRQTHERWRWATDSLHDALTRCADGSAPLLLLGGSLALAPTALERIAARWSDADPPDLVYADEDAICSDGDRGEAFLKPGWSPELLRRLDYVGPFVALGPRAAAALEAGEAAPQTIDELVLGLIDSSLRVERIPQVLFTSAYPRLATAASRPRIRRVLTEHPRVSLVIPTGFAGEFVADCVRSVREHTSYPALQVVVVDSSRNGRSRLREMLSGIDHAIVPYQGKFNFAEAVNAGARAAAGEHLVLLNDDTEVVSPDWVQEMLGLLLVPGVGVVGPKLLTPEGVIQHAGIVVDFRHRQGWHVYGGFPADAAGYHGTLLMERNVLAVTGACLMVRADLFARLRGLDPVFAHEYSDVDFCLRAADLGLRTAWTPHAVLMHRERSSLPPAGNPLDGRRFYERWSHRYGTDPYYHPAFTSLSYELSRAASPSLPAVDAGRQQPHDAGSPAPAFASPPASFDEMQRALAAGGLGMWCDYPPLDGTATADGQLTVIGWAHSLSGVVAVAVFVDGVRHEARRGRLRSDISAVYGAELALAGFDLTIELAPEQAGRLPVTVVAYDTAGHAVGVSGTVESRSAAPSPLGASPRADGRVVRDTIERFDPELHAGTIVECEHLARYRWAAGVIAGREVLDAGCGVGYGTELLARAGASRAVGVDLSAAAIDRAHEMFCGQCGFIAADLAALPFLDDTFDVVVCLEAIEHVVDPGRVLDEFRRVLRAGGLLLISTPNRTEYPAGNRFHLHEFLPEELHVELARRFPAVRLYQQSSYGASLISPDGGLAGAGSVEVAGSTVHRLVDPAAPEEMYTLAVAGAAPLPEPGSLVTIGSVLAGAAVSERWHDLHERVLDAEATARAAETEVQVALTERDRALELVARAEQGRLAAERERELADARLRKAERELAERRAPDAVD